MDATIAVSSRSFGEKHREDLYGHILGQITPMHDPRQLYEFVKSLDGYIEDMLERDREEARLKRSRLNPEAPSFVPRTAVLRVRSSRLVPSREHAMMMRRAEATHMTMHTRMQGVNQSIANIERTIAQIELTAMAIQEASWHPPRRGYR